MRRCFPVFRERKSRNCCHFWIESAVTGKNDTRKMRIHSNMGTGMDAGMTADIMKDIGAGMTADTMRDTGAGMTVDTTMVTDTVEAQMGMEVADRVEIYQKVSALCHHRRPVHDWRGDDGSGAAGIHEPNRG